MDFAIVFVMGLLIGWLIEWVIDWFYWRRFVPVDDFKSKAATGSTGRVRYSSKPSNADNLSRIIGVGPVIARRLNKSGIYTFEQLGNMDLDEFDKALGDVRQRFINERAIIRHARELAERKRLEQAS